MRKEPAWVRGLPLVALSNSNFGQPPNLPFFHGQMKKIARLNIKQEHSFNKGLLNAYILSTIYSSGAV